MDETADPSKKRKAEEIAENGDDDNKSATAGNATDEKTAEAEVEDKAAEGGNEKPQDSQAELKGTQEDAANDKEGDTEMKDADAKESDSSPTAEASPSQDKTAAETPKAALAEKKDDTPVNAYDKLKWVVVENDGTPGNMIKLVGLKSLFAKQLPKMPRAYIARLVFDKRHISLAILSEDPAVKDSDEEIIGGICFRPFEEMRFAEIAFCAVSATHQVKVSMLLTNQ